MLIDWPAAPDAAKLPRYGDRRTLAAIHERYFGPLSHRSIETWPLPWRRVNGRAVALVADFLAEAQRRFDAAPVVRSGGRLGRPAQQPAA